MSVKDLATIGAQIMVRGGSDVADQNKINTALNRLLQAMNAHPEMIEAKSAFDAELLEAINSICYVKRGAMGTMLVGLNTTKHGAIGIAAKVADGSSRPIPPVVIGVLSELDLLSADELEKLEVWRRKVLKNHVGTVTGDIQFVR